MGQKEMDEALSKWARESAIPHFRKAKELMEEAARLIGMTQELPTRIEPVRPWWKFWK